MNGEKELVTIALQLVRDHYEGDDAGFDESCVELELWCYDHGEADLAEYAMANRCPVTAFVPMGGGKLTAEQVEKIVMSADCWDWKYSYPSIREDAWQAMADELNAALGSGTCKVESVKFHRWGGEGCDTYEFFLSCGHEVELIEEDEPPKYCPECGMAVGE